MACANPRQREREGNTCPINMRGRWDEAVGRAHEDSAFSLPMRPGQGSEPGNGWHWATSLAGFGHEVTVLINPWDRDAILELNPPGVDFRFIDFPESGVGRVSKRFGPNDLPGAGKRPR